MNEKMIKELKRALEDLDLERIQKLAKAVREIQTVLESEGHWFIEKV